MELAGKRIGVLTSGGDCAGLNAVVRAVVHRAVQGYGMKVIGIEQGTAGLLARPVMARELDPSIFTGDILRRGGTILGTTNKGNPFSYEMPDGQILDRSEEIIEAYRELELHALIGIGGDGSMAILRRLAEQGGLNFIGVPKTIDNDLGHTEVSVGYATAVDIATQALDQLQPTAASHSRVMVLEVMGRDAGHIALNAGVAGGADIILIPEVKYSLASIKRKIERTYAEGRNFLLVIVAEAVRDEEGQKVTETQASGAVTYGGIGEYIGHRIAEETGAETRVTVLGHLQRGGVPSARDRIMGSTFGVHAVDLVAAGKFDRLVAWSGRHCFDVPLQEAIAGYRAVQPDSSVMLTARGLGICFGDD
ncbi:ATP-dependent 6-phosphofructokinase [Kiloniella laminariae]|uniref:ATP-dependent 6-phosphofructokinase n=1 Tax=Kiloniella laminariae TaxID=454162 RepID=UPI00037F59C2|nr:ATP-dependent 6-phosphofructokinase [Kiloniella laminariae]